MSRYSKEQPKTAKELIPDIIPALKESYEKWIEGAKQTKESYIDWWWSKGVKFCALCAYFESIKRSHGRCGGGEISCPLKDAEKLVCAIEYREIARAIAISTFPAFSKNAILLRDRLGELFRVAEEMAVLKSEGNQ